MLSKILITNRGKIAARLIRACREMGIGAVAAPGGGNSDGDRFSPWDRADGFRIGG